MRYFARTAIACEQLAGWSRVHRRAGILDIPLIFCDEGSRAQITA